MTKKNYQILLLSFVLASISAFTYAQQDRNESIIRQSLKGFEYEVKAGISIGGTSPLPLPEEIRSINRYNPTLAVSIEGNVTKWFDAKWGAQLGLRLENKGMKTDATVKNYGMEMTSNEGGYMKGMWTGDIHTKVDNSYITVPILAMYKLSNRVKLKAGLYAGYMLDGEFSGAAYNGYLRDEDPTGTKFTVVEASYDFSDDLRKFAWGVQAGADWRAFKHLNVFADFTWGINDIFKNDFNTITFPMYPIYLNIGFGYAF